MVEQKLYYGDATLFGGGECYDDILQKLLDKGWRIVQISLDGKYGNALLLLERERVETNGNGASQD